MRNLPDRFPIRYAIIASNWDVEDNLREKDQPQFFTPAKFELLFRQLLVLLQKESLTGRLLNPPAQTLKCQVMDVDILDIAKLNAPVGWCIKLEEEIKKIIPEAMGFSSSIGTAFDLGLYSYTGAYEIPAFIVAKNILRENEIAFPKSSRWITQDVYDKRLKKEKELQADNVLQKEDHTNADREYHITASTVFNLAKRALEIFDSSEVPEKRQFLSYLLQNSVLDGRKLAFTLRNPFNLISQYSSHPTM